MDCPAHSATCEGAATALVPVRCRIVNCALVGVDDNMSLIHPRGIDQISTSERPPALDQFEDHQVDDFGDPRGEYVAAQSLDVLFDLSSRSQLELAGLLGQPPGTHPARPSPVPAIVLGLVLIEVCVQGRVVVVIEAWHWRISMGEGTNSLTWSPGVSKQPLTTRVVPLSRRPG
jgi:hypothetical protein